MTEHRTIGVVIRTLNESELIGTCLRTLNRQQPGFDLDLLVVDSGSTDDTVEIARSHGARILEIAPEDFDYSKALNAGIAEVRGELILALSAHAIPLDEHWVARMIAPFADDRVAGVASRQLPWPGAPFNEVHRLANTFTQTGRTYTAEDGGDVLFSNAASCIRRIVWQQHPFTLPAAEDLEWARRIVQSGGAIVYEPHARVFHSHDESPRSQARRLIDINRGGIDCGRRTRAKTVREAARYLTSDSRLIAKLDEPMTRKLGYMVHLLKMVVFYVADFSRSGTTAQFRREGDGAVS